ncbi:MAG TPA: hypothetical protein VKB84_20690 [Candidatus Binataceae bacterium]|nr:hypothetical protein [Candidatus Binataceae bacterium]
MQTTIAQAVALTIYGNNFIQGYPWEDFWPAATVFRFCKHVAFAILDPPGTAIESAFAADPAQWITKLRDETVIGLRLHHVARSEAGSSDRESAGFAGGGGRWLIESVRNATSDFWEARWRVQNQNDPDRKVWDIIYCRVAKDRARALPDGRGIGALRRELENALLRIEGFANQQKLEVFAKSFRCGIELLHADDPLSSVHHSDLARGALLPLEARQILGAAQAAWVFGGMGSWNDLGFEGIALDEYTALSDQLFSLINQAICEAANSGFRAGT